MKRGDLIQANFMTKLCTKETKIGIILDYHENHIENHGKIKMLCNSGEIREFISVYGGVEKIQ